MSFVRRPNLALPLKTAKRGDVSAKPYFQHKTVLVWCAHSGLRTWITAPMSHRLMSQIGHDMVSPEYLLDSEPVLHAGTRTKFSTF